MRESRGPLSRPTDGGAAAPSLSLLAEAVSAAARGPSIMKIAARSLLAFAALAASACAVSADKAIPCYDDASCPKDYPVCEGGSQGHTGFCKLPAAGDPQQAGGVVAIVGVQGAVKGASVHGKIKVDVVARAASGIKQVTLTSESHLESFPQVPATPPLYTFEVDTTGLADGTVNLKASVQSGDGSVVPPSNAYPITTDNTPPVITVAGSVGNANARPGGIVSLAVSSNEPLSALTGTVSLAGAPVGTLIQAQPPAGSAANTYLLTYQVAADATAGAYDINVDATDLPGNVARNAIAPVHFAVRRPFRIASIAAAAASSAVENGFPAAGTNGALSVTLVLPAGVDLGGGRPAFTFTDAAGRSRSLAAATSSDGRTWLASAQVQGGDADGLATLSATAVDASGNSDSIQTGFLVDKTPASVSALVVGSPVVDTASGTQTLTAVASKPIAQARLTTSNGDLATCTPATGGPAGTAISCTIALTHQASSAQTVTATLVVTDLVGNVSQQQPSYSATYSSVPPVATPSLSVDQATITAGGSVALTAVFTNATATINGAAVTSNVPQVVSPSSNTTYTLTVVNAAGHSDSTQSVAVNVVPAPSFATALTASALTITAGDPVTLTAAASNASAVTIRGGSLSNAAFTSGMTVSPSSTTTYTVTAANGATRPATVSQSVTIVVLPAPAVASFTASNSTITLGQSTTLTASFSNGAGTVDQGVGAITAGPAISIKPAATTTYTLTVSNGSGSSAGSVTRSVTVTVVLPPTASLTAAAVTIDAGTSTTLTPVFSRGTAAIDQSVTVGASNAPIVVSPSVTTTYTLTVTNAAGATATAQVTITVVAPVSISSFTAGASSLTAGSSTSLTPVFTGGAAVISGGLGSVASGQVITVAPSVTTTYVLTVTNASGGSATRSVTINVYAAPAIASFGAAASPITSGTATTLTASFTGGAASITNISGAVTSGVAVSTGNLTSTTAFALTVTNPAGATATAQVTVVVASGAVAASLTSNAPSGSLTAGQSAQITPSFSGGTGTITSTIDSTTLVAANGVAITVTPASTATYTLSVTNGAGQPPQQTSVTITVYPAPTLTSFTATAASGSALSVIDATNTSLFFSGVFANGTGNITGPGITAPGIALTSTVGKTVAAGASLVLPVVDSVYTLTVTNAAGGTASATAKILVVPNATAQLKAGGGASVTITSGASTTLSPVCANGSQGAVIDNGIGAVSSGSAVTVAPTASSTTYNLVCTNAANHTASASATVSVVPAAVINTFTASAATVTSATQFTLSFSTANASSVALVDSSNATLSTGASPVTVTAPTVTTNTTVTYTLTARNVAGSAVSQAINVIVVPAPTAQLAFTAPSAGASINVNPHASVTLQATYPAGTSASINGIPVPGAAINPTTLQGSVTVNNVVSTTTYLLTVSNSAGGTATANATANVNAIIGSFAATAVGGGNGTVQQGQAFVKASAPGTVTTLSATFEGSGASGNAPGTVTCSPACTAMSINPGGSLSVSPSVTTTYSLAVAPSGTGSTPAPQSTTVWVLAPPVGVSLGGATSITSGTSTQLAPVFPTAAASGIPVANTATLQAGAAPGLQAVTTGSLIAVSPSTTTTYALAVTDPAGNVTTASAQVTVVAPAAISSFSAAPATATAGTPVTLSWTVSGATASGSLQQGANPALTVTLASGAQSVAAPAATDPAGTAFPYRLTVQNSVGTQSMANASVTVYPLPTASLNFGTSSGPTALGVAPGASFTLVPTCSANSVASVNPAGSTTNISRTTTYVLTCTNPAGGATTASATATVSPLAISLVAAAPALTTGGSTTLTANFAGSGASGNAPATVSCTGPAGCGLPATTVLSGATVTATPAAAGHYVYSLTVTGSDGSTAARTAVVDVYPAANATSLVASPTSINTGSQVTLTPVFDFAGGAAGSAKIAGSDGTTFTGLASGVGVPASPSATTTYTLYVYNAASAQAASTPAVTVTVIPSPSIATFSCDVCQVTSGAPVRLSYSFANGTGAIDQGVGALAGTSGSTVVNPTSTTTYRLTVTGSSGTAVSRSLRVVVDPQITSFTASPTHITAGATVSLTANFNSGSSAAITGPDGTNLAVTSGLPVSVSPASTITYTLTVQPVAPSATVATATVQVVLDPSITSFTVNGGTSATVGAGQPLTFAASYSNGGSGTVAATPSGPAAFTLTSGTPSTQPAGSAGSTFTYTLTVPRISPSAVDAQQSVTVNVAPGTWAASSTQAMGVRFAATVTAVNATMVLVAGGNDAAGNPLSSAAICNTTTGSCALVGGATPLMSSPRAYAAAVTLPGNRVLVTGGYSGPNKTTAVRSTDVYDLATDKFIPAVAMATERAQHTATVLADGSIFITGGINAAATPAAMSSTEVIASNLLTTTGAGAMTQPRFGHAAALSGTRLLVVGGKAGNNLNELLDVSTSAPATSGGTLVNGSVSTVEDKANPTATTITAGPNAGKVFVTGGVITSSGSPAPSGNSYLCTVTGTPACTAVATGLSRARSAHAAVSLGAKVLICGGLEAGGPTRSCEVFDSTANGNAGGMLPTADMTETRTSFGLAPVTGGVFAVGGNDTVSAARPFSEIYTP